MATSSSTKLPKWQRILLGIVGVLVATLVGWFIIAAFGRVIGTEFSPETFATRSFQYYEIPLLRIQITGIERKQAIGSLETHLAANKLIDTKSTSPNPVWHLVDFSRAGGAAKNHGDAAILGKYLDTYDYEGNEFWLAWSKEHPEMAKVLWPIVQDVALHEMYVLSPDLFAAAREASDADDLTLRLDEILVARYQRLANSQQELGNHKLAKALFDLALKYAPTGGTLRDSLIERRRISDDAAKPKAEAEPPGAEGGR